LLFRRLQTLEKQSLATAALRCRDPSAVIRIDVPPSFAPGVGEYTPGVDEYTPGVYEYTPRVCEYTPRVCEYTPRVCEYTPRVCEYTPRVCEYTPRVCEYTPGVYEYTPGGRRIFRNWCLTSLGECLSPRDSGFSQCPPSYFRTPGSVGVSSAVDARHPATSHARAGRPRSQGGHLTVPTCTGRR